MHYQKSKTQKDFLQVAECHPVTYRHPATFQAGEAVYTAKAESLPRFLFRLSTVMSFADYDRLTRKIWLAHMGAKRDPYAKN
jgi:hypothetical protein